MKPLLIFFITFTLVGSGCTSVTPNTNQPESTIPESVTSDTNQPESTIPEKKEISQPANSDSQADNSPSIKTEPIIDDIFAILPPNEWRQVSQWKVLENGNYWLLTRQIVSKDDKDDLVQTNPCSQKSDCPVESWIIDPQTNTAHLTSSTNSYLSQVDVTATPQSNSLLRLDWDITTGNVTRSHQYRIETVDITTGDQLIPILTPEEFNQRYNQCLMHADMTEEQLSMWGITNNNSGACRIDDNYWLVISSEDDVETFYNHKLSLYSNDGELIDQSEEGTFCGGSANGVPQMTFSQMQLTCARVEAGCGGVITWRITINNDSFWFTKIQDHMELCVD